MGVPSGRSETVRTGLGVGNSEVVGGGGAAAGGGTSGVSTVAATGVAVRPPAGDFARSAAAGGLACAAEGLPIDASALKSTGCSSELMTLTEAGFALSLRRDPPASLEAVTVSSLGGCTLVGP